MHNDEIWHDATTDNYTTTRYDTIQYVSSRDIRILYDNPSNPTLFVKYFKTTTVE